MSDRSPAPAGPARGTVVLVCLDCAGADGVPLGPALLDRLGPLGRGVPCMAVCTRPLTVAFAAPGRWSYLVGDVDPVRDADDVLLAARAVDASAHGVPALAERPPFFRRGVVARLPPVP